MGKKRNKQKPHRYSAAAVIKSQGMVVEEVVFDGDIVCRTLDEAEQIIERKTRQIAKASYEDSLGEDYEIEVCYIEPFDAQHKATPKKEEDALNVKDIAKSIMTALVPQNAAKTAPKQLPAPSTQHYKPFVCPIEQFCKINHTIETIGKADI